MKTIIQGRYELSCTKDEAVERFREMAGICREEISDDNAIGFYCTGKGAIAISNPPRNTKRSMLYDSATALYGQIVEEEGKTYLTYYTTFSKLESVMKVIYTVITMIMAIFAIVSAVINSKSPLTLMLGIGCLVVLVRQLYINANEKSYAYQDSEIMIKVLEERVNAVNHWDE